MVFCVNCGKPIHKGAHFCHRCGMKTVGDTRTWGRSTLFSKGSPTQEELASKARDPDEDAGPAYEEAKPKALTDGHSTSTASDEESNTKTPHPSTLQYNPNPPAPSDANFLFDPIDGQQTSRFIDVAAFLFAAIDRSFGTEEMRNTHGIESDKISHCFSMMKTCKELSDFLYIPERWRILYEIIGAECVPFNNGKIDMQGTVLTWNGFRTLLEHEIKVYPSIMFLGIGTVLGATSTTLYPPLSRDDFPRKACPAARSLHDLALQRIFPSMY